MQKKAYLGFDLGAGSGRAILGILEGNMLKIQEVHRFNNPVKTLNDRLDWDIEHIWNNLVEGIRLAGESTKKGGAELVSVGVDTWGVDYALIGEDGRLLDSPRNYRDKRNRSAMEKVLSSVPKNKIYGISGIQFMPINTLYQLVAHREINHNIINKTSRFLMMPDLMHYFLSGNFSNESTIASTSQMVDVRTKQWSQELISIIGLPATVFGDLVEPGTYLGNIKPEIAERACVSKDLKVIIPASHDTAAAVAAIPTNSSNSWCYISSGTWSLLGAEIPSPITNQEAFEFNFTNERGINNTTRFHKNIQAMWFFQQCKDYYFKNGTNYNDGDLLELASKAAPFRTVIDTESQRFSEPGNMPLKIQHYAEDSKQPIPRNAGEVIRVCAESLAVAYRNTLNQLENITRKRFDVIHIVGGGGYNSLVNQMTADATGRDVIVGPFEGSCSGNILTQAMGDKEICDLEEIREISRNSFKTKTYKPQGKRSNWDGSLEKYKDLIGRRDELTI